jgi:hypothetical protein
MAMSEHSTRRVIDEIERTGLFRAPPTALGRRSLRADPIQLLAAAATPDEVLRASVGYFTRIFKEVVALGIHKGSAIVLMAGNQGGLRTPQQPPHLPLSEGTLVRSVLDRPQVAYRRNADASLAVLCSAVNIPSSNLTLVPAFDYGRPAFIVIGQGLEEWQLKDRFGEIKIFIGKVSKALHIVALRAEILRGETPDARFAPLLELYAQTQVPGAGDVRIMAIHNLSTGEAFLEGTLEQYPELEPGTQLELVIFGFEDGVEDDPKFHIQCRARVVRVAARSAGRRAQGFVVAVQPVDQANRERLTSLVLRDSTYWPVSRA